MYDDYNNLISIQLSCKDLKDNPNAGLRGSSYPFTPKKHHHLKSKVCVLGRHYCSAAMDIQFQLTNLIKVPQLVEIMTFTECEQKSENAIHQEQNQLMCPQNYKMHNILLHTVRNTGVEKRLCVDCRSDSSELHEHDVAICKTGLTGEYSISCNYHGVLA